MLDQIKSAVEFASHIPRYREIVGILLKYGFADVLRLMALQRFLGIEDAAPAVHESGLLAKPLPERLRLALEELGPTFIKFGQIISSRRDLVTDDYYTELCRLQSSVPPFPAETAREILAEELGRPVAAVFEEFEDEPVGAASIAQVHRARLRNGAEVAVKIQRPDIQKVIELDLAILRDLARFVERHAPDLATLNPCGIVEEFSATILQELDFTNEARNAERFGQQFAANAHIQTPHIHREFSSSKVLTMEFVGGCVVDDTEALGEMG
ncbi:MAG: AarF/UbiB family protein, partial [Terrimicrobiaceae bacterium]|nr:AarF/UbiB family protein [Terrimicrobiaceae bacterium]